jgi:alkaline phosphatase D
MKIKFSRRGAIKTMSLALGSSLLARVAQASPTDWVLGFGSCMNARKNQSFWQAILGRRFDHWVFLGDNLYPEVDNLEYLTRAYSELENVQPLKELVARVPVSATWDDHDFGADNADGSLPYKYESMKLFRTFWKQDYASECDGVYSAQIVEHQGRKIHLILLDLRFNRTPHGEFAPVNSESDEMKSAAAPQLLGETQWQWLESEFEKQADIRIVCSSIQVLSHEHRFEKWKNYPAEYERLMGLVGRNSAPTVFLSGDRHLHEVSRVQLVSGRTLYDFTSSGLNKAAGLSRFERNRLRVQRSLDDGFGELRLTWIEGVPKLTMSMIDKDGQQRFSQFDFLV